jgi:hypothetical protein
MTDAELLKAETSARDNSHAKVRDVTPPEKSRIACLRANEWLMLMEEIKRRGLKPCRDTIIHEVNT